MRTANPLVVVTLVYDYAQQVRQMATTSTQSTFRKMPKSVQRNSDLLAPKKGNEEKCPTEGDLLADVVSGCQQGDRAAQRQFYELCQQNIFRLVTRMVGLQEAGDVMQQVFLQAFRCIGQFNGRSRIETWLYRLAVNEALQYLRRNRRWKYQTLDWEPMDESHPREDTERKELLEQALARIAPELRAIFLLREIEGLSYQDIAEALQIPEGTVGSRLNRARHDLKQQLLELGFEL